MASHRSLFVIVLLTLAAGGCGEEQTPAPSAPPPSAAEGKRDASTTASESSRTAPAPKRPEQEAEGGARMAPTPATVLRETELKDKPSVDAKTLRRLPAQTRLTLIERSGGWFKVERDGAQGWVRLLHVSSQPAGSGSAARELESVAKMATGRAGSGNIVNTTGIRGLSEEQLRQSQPNPAELQRFESYGVDKEQAAAYARQHKLETRQVAELPAPR